MRLVEAEIGFQPLEIGGDALLGDEQREPLEVLEFLDALIGMRDQHLRVLLEHGGDRDGRNVLLDRVEALQRVGAHEEVDLADRQQQPVVHVRAARHDGDVEPVFPIGAVGERLIEAAMLGLAPPSWCRTRPCRAAARGPPRQRDREQRTASETSVRSVIDIILLQPSCPSCGPASRRELGVQVTKSLPARHSTRP